MLGLLIKSSKSCVFRYVVSKLTGSVSSTIRLASMSSVRGERARPLCADSPPLSSSKSINMSSPRLHFFHGLPLTGRRFFSDVVAGALTETGLSNAVLHGGGVPTSDSIAYTRASSARIRESRSSRALLSSAFRLSSSSSMNLTTSSIAPVCNLMNA